MFSVPNNDQNEAGTLRFRPSPEAVYDYVGDQAVLIHMRTNQIYELNWTASRFWELLCAGHNQAKIQQLMLQEFDVAEADLSHEIEALLASLKNKGLIKACEES
jgi:hypothetical protein